MSPAVISVFMIVVFVALAGFDLYLSHGDKVADNTFSARFRALGRFWPPARLLIAASLGAVLAHLWWTPQDVHDAGGGQLCRCPLDAGPKDAGPKDAGP